MSHTHTQNPIDRIAVIGASGRVGSQLVKLCQKRGIPANLLVRNPSGLPALPASFTIVEGDARDPLAIEKVLTQCNAVINVIGQTRKEPPLFLQVARIITEQMDTLSIKRYIGLGGIGVKTEADRHYGKTAVKVRLLNLLFPKVMADRRLELDFLNTSGLKWTYYRVPLIRNTGITGDLCSNEFTCNGRAVDSAGLAGHMLDHLDSEPLFGHAPFLWEK